MSVVFQSWDFYRQQLMEEAEQFGWPLARHMMLVFPNNSMVYQEDLRYQFMVGTELLVAPVHTRIVLLGEVAVFLPQNTSWVHVWSGKTYTGMCRVARGSLSPSLSLSLSLSFSLPTLMV